MDVLEQSFKAHISQAVEDSSERSLMNLAAQHSTAQHSSAPAGTHWR